MNDPEIAKVISFSAKEFSLLGMDTISIQNVPDFVAVVKSVVAHYLDGSGVILYPSAQRKMEWEVASALVEQCVVSPSDQVCIQDAVREFCAPAYPGSDD